MVWTFLITPQFTTARSVNWFQRCWFQTRWKATARSVGCFPRAYKPLRRAALLRSELEPIAERYNAEQQNGRKLDLIT